MTQDNGTPTGVARRRRSAVGLLLYLAASAVLFRSFLVHPQSRAPLGGRSDPGQMMWFMESMAQSIVHGHNPFVTHAMYAPQGTNLMWSQTMPLAGAILAPITLTLGPVVSVNVLFFLGPPLTAFTAWLWLGRHVRHPAAAWLGGAFVGFGPFVAAHLQGHASLVVLPLMPLTLYLLEDILWRAPPQRRRFRAVLLGLVLAGQALMSEEIVVLLAIGVVVAALVALAVRPRLTIDTVRVAIPSGLLAIAVFAVVLGWPVGTQLFGPLRAPGVAYPAIVSQPRDLVSPTARFLFHPWVNDSLHHARRHTGLAETSGYLGVPLLALLGVGLVLLRRRWAVWVAAATAAICFWMSMGVGLTADGRAGWRLPFGPLFHLPGLSTLVVQRLTLPRDLALAFVAALTVDQLLARRGKLLTVAALGVVVLSLAPVAPPGPKEVRVPPFFTAGAMQVPEGAVVLVLPAPTNLNGNAAMLWAAEAELHFDMVGGYGYVKHGDALSGHSYPDPISVLGDRITAGGPPPTTAEADSARRWLAALGVQNVLVGVDEDKGHGYEQAARAVFGPPPIVEGGALLWFL